MNTRRREGFSLVEVLVALVVVALALLALARTATVQVRTFDALRERTLAGWVAANVLAEARLAAALPPTGRSDGQLDLGGRRWRWQREVQATADAQIRRVDIRVFVAEAREPSASLTGFVP
jgi:general secretion pathway protein I